MTTSKEREQFYKNAKTKYNFNAKKVADVLQRAGHTTFNIANVKEYHLALTEVKKQIQELKKKHGLVDEHHYDLCPLCPGLKVMGQDGWPWICSKGGSLHMIVWKAGLMKVRAMNPDLENEDAATKALEYAKEILITNGKTQKKEQTA